jgi:hypothetical protein
MVDRYASLGYIPRCQRGIVVALFTTR